MRTVEGVDDICEGDLFYYRCPLGTDKAYFVRTIDENDGITDMIVVALSGDRLMVDEGEAQDYWNEDDVLAIERPTR